MILQSRALLAVFLGIVLLTGCRRNKLEPKGFSVGQNSEDESEEKIDGISKDSIILKTRPGAVLLTGWPEYRLTSLFKVNYNKKKKRSFIGSIGHHWNYGQEGNTPNNQWHHNYLPGIDAVYGYNLVNISVNHRDSQTRTELFKSPVLIKTLYYPAFSKDTLNGEPIKRDYYLVTCYDDDTNKDGYINVRDLRRLYWFDLQGNPLGKLIPANFSVLKSDYDSANDFMYIYAKKDENDNGRREDRENIHVFWVDLKDPGNNGQFY